jgi:alkylation response protein AidB-like acyl-CoA dehydrogenase
MDFDLSPDLLALRARARAVAAAGVAEVMGPDAVLWDDVGRGLAYAPGYTIMGGTSNVMRNILGERVLGLPREPLQGDK